MKKLFIAAALAGSTFALAQVDFSQTRFGITAGYNYSRVSNAHNPSGPRHTFQAGVMALIPIGNNDQFYIQPEVEYYGSGETGKNKDSKGKSGYNALYANNYISVPVYFKGYFSEAESEFFGLIGPRFNFLMNQQIKDYPVNKPYYTADSYGKAGKFNFAIGAGIGYSYKRQLELAVKYDLGLSDTFPDLKNSPDVRAGDANLQKKKSQQVLSVGLSYIFQ